MLDTAETWLRSLRETEHSIEVTYGRGAVSNSAVPATQAETTAESDTGDVIVEATVVDWIIDRADLTLDGDEVEPRVGDTIVATRGGRTVTYEVAAVGDQPPFRPHGRDGQSVRIHTVETGWIEIEEVE